MQQRNRSLLASQWVTNEMCSLGYNSSPCFQASEIGLGICPNCVQLKQVKTSDSLPGHARCLMGDLCYQGSNTPLYNSWCFLCRWSTASFPLSVNPSPPYPYVHTYPQTFSTLKKVDLRLGTFYLLIFGNPVSKLSCQTVTSDTHGVGRTSDAW